MLTIRGLGITPETGVTALGNQFPQIGSDCNQNSGSLPIGLHSVSNFDNEPSSVDFGPAGVPLIWDGANAGRELEVSNEVERLQSVWFWHIK